MNGGISMTLRLSIAIRYFAGGSPFDLMSSHDETILVWLSIAKYGLRFEYHNNSQIDRNTSNLSIILNHYTYS